ncbi:MAG: ribosomal RNA small subunit methyltransferase A|nr:ribosomal RNA small subunit methyltransferase A [Candidatus Buchananbacteria bacterium]
MNLAQIKYLCRQYGIKPSKLKGQNFLIDQSVLQKIIKAAELKKNGYILEIGPGFGILTKELIKTAQKVLSVELDKSLVYFLQHQFKGISNLQILPADILAIKNSELSQILGSQDYKLVANLPYSITKAVLRKFLSFEPKPSQIIVLVQKEVAQKILAKPGQMNILALTVLFYGQPKLIDYVAKSSFYPQPKVDSAILKIKIHKQTISDEIKKVLDKKTIANFQEKKFWQLVKIGFSSPRKQLHNNLAAGLKLDNLQVKKILKKNGLRQDIRPQELSLENWAYFYQQFMV